VQHKCTAEVHCAVGSEVAKFLVQQHFQHPQNSQTVAECDALEMGNDLPVPLWHSFVAGATSGLAARIVTFPADTLKARLQIKGAVSGDVSQYRTTAAAARHILTTEGAGGFFTGFGAVLWGVVPANLAYFGGGYGVHASSSSAEAAWLVLPLPRKTALSVGPC
jgi:hypothetical protein